MKDIRKKIMGNSVSSVASMLLFLLFTVCMLLIIAAAAGSYNRISTNRDKGFGISTSLHYIGNKIKSAESVEIINNGKGLILRNGDIADVIYFQENGLYENSVLNSDTLNYEDGEKIFTLDEFEIVEQEGLYKVSVKSGSEKNFVLIREGD